MHLIVIPPSFALLQRRIRAGTKYGQMVRFTMVLIGTNTNSGIHLIGTLVHYQYLIVSLEFQREHLKISIN